MTGNIVIDFSNWRPSSPQALKKAGVVGVYRYLMPASRGWPKAITKAELDGYLAVGLQVAFNFETSTDAWRHGYDGGVADGTLAGTAMRELGLGSAVPVAPSFDEFIRPNDFPLAADYARGFQRACGHEANAYGEGALIEYLAAQGLCNQGWLSESTSFPGSAAPTPHTALWQHYGRVVGGLPGSYDVNEVIKPDWGQYPRPTVALPVPPKPLNIPTTPGGVTHDMANAKTQLIKTTGVGLGQFIGVYDAGAPVTAAQATVQGPDPHVADTSSKDDLWPFSIGADARVNVHGNKVVVTVNAPNCKTDSGPSVYVTAVLA